MIFRTQLMLLAKGVACLLLSRVYFRQIYTCRLYILLPVFIRSFSLSLQKKRSAIMSVARANRVIVIFFLSFSFFTPHTKWKENLKSFKSCKIENGKIISNWLFEFSSVTRCFHKKYTNNNWFNKNFISLFSTDRKSNQCWIGWKLFLKIKFIK